MTTADIITKTRQFLQDTTSPYHWSDVELKTNIQLAIRRLHWDIPATRYVDGVLVVEVTLPVSNSDPISISDRYMECLACYACHLCFADDSTDAVSEGLTDKFLKMYKERLFG